MPAFNENYSFDDWLREGENIDNVRWASKPHYHELSRVVQALIPEKDYSWYGGNSVEEIEESFLYPPHDGDV